MGYFTEANGALMEVSGFCITCESTGCDHYHSFPLRAGLVLFLLARLFENQECRVEKRPLSALSYTEQEAIISHTEERMSIRSSGLFLRKSSLYPTKELFHSLVLFFPFEIDYTTIDSRRSSL